MYFMIFNVFITSSITASNHLILQVMLVGEFKGQKVQDVKKMIQKFLVDTVSTRKCIRLFYFTLSDYFILFITNL